MAFTYYFSFLMPKKEDKLHTYARLLTCCTCHNGAKLIMGFSRFLEIFSLKLIHQDISSAYFILIVDLRERGTWFVLTLFTRHYFTDQIILEIILTIRNMEIYYRKHGSLANK